MKVGDYVRTNEFGIQKVKWFDNEEPILENGFTALQSSGYKSSPNIIDLIEVGDYVNGEKVIDKFDYLLAFGNADYYNEEDIKSIVTKEQFEAMKYEIKTICFGNDLEEKMYSIKDNLEYRISDLYNAILKKEE